MLSIQTRTAFDLPSKTANEITPLRPKRRISSKIIFLALEGTATEESYFNILQKLYPEVASKIKLISIQENIVNKREKNRTTDEKHILGQTQPWQLEKKMTVFKNTYKDEYQFDSEDEFWLVMDVDEHWDKERIVHEEKTSFELWNETIAACSEKNYNYAISNPFFENWLLLHHRDPISSDMEYAVTPEHAYEKTDYYKRQLSDLKVPLKDGKKVQLKHYSKEKIEKAVERAKMLHHDKRDLEPAYYATTVYLLVDKVIDLYHQMTYL